ncbi:hypothetical protein GDO78_022223 [Eleutherodactylus coqui]|uniref:Secreted protein n=1 Tax=Eleutherodactylus coqui TaxID=57060 RepID=A0A8J6JRX7_ELECQ|nr:hypothetical protein GDO78_022223 [Eleutherodactylus coqui]
MIMRQTFLLIDIHVTHGALLAQCGTVNSITTMSPPATQMKYSFFDSSTDSCKDGSFFKAVSEFSANSEPLSSLVRYVPLCRYR